jgi:hypothetical protein
VKYLGEESKHVVESFEFVKLDVFELLNLDFLSLLDLIGDLGG